jgi:hypothetical protein
MPTLSSILSGTFQGAQGAQGFQGVQGAQGAQGAQGVQGATGSAGSITDDTSTNATRYPLFVSATSGTLVGVNVSSSKLTFNPSSGTRELFLQQSLHHFRIELKRQISLPLRMP